MKPVLILDCGSSKVPDIERCCRLTGKPFITQKLLQLEQVNDVSGIIISGAPILLTEVEHTQFLEKAKIIFSNPELPVLGICFGHQLMGIYHLAEVSRCTEDRSWQTIFVTHPNDLVAPGSYKYMEDHCECITFPPGFIYLGSSLVCPNEMMKHPANPWYGVQFHPEVSGEAGERIIANFIAICKKV